MKSFAAGIFFLWIISPSALAAQTPETPMTADELGCLQSIIYFNECAGKPENLTTWNSDEEFPSLGIGHFIWYPTGYTGPYKELFPEFLAFMEAQDEAIPAWIAALPGREAPWPTREVFFEDLESERMTELRDFLENTQEFQTRFVILRTEGILPRMLETIPEAERTAIELKFHEVADAPNGMFALTDYVNFKGEGILETERLRGQGWGLLQVLQEMRAPEEREDALKEFVRAAKKVLENRIRNAPPERDQSKRLRGWKKRVKNYLKIDC